MRFSNEYGFCDLNEFPGCNSLVVSNHAYVYKEHRGKGHGKDNHRLRLDRAKALGYSAIICTVLDSNATEKHILRTNGWEICGQFVNHEGVMIDIFLRRLDGKEAAPIRPRS